MQAVLDRGAGALGIRLLQDAFNTGSLSLYASLGRQSCSAGASHMGCGS
jgi:hypothetical protein